MSGIWVGNLPREVSREEISHIFMDFGSVQYVLVCISVYTCVCLAAYLSVCVECVCMYCHVRVVCVYALEC